MYSTGSVKKSAHIYFLVTYIQPSEAFKKIPTVKWKIWVGFRQNVLYKRFFYLQRLLSIARFYKRRNLWSFLVHRL